MPVRQSPAQEIPAKQITRAQLVICSALLFAFALVLRLVHINQSLWVDEMSTYLDYVLAPWHIVVAAQPGQYVPNNHVLYTILAKLLFSMKSGDPLQISEPLLRFPSLLAGSFLPLAVAWPLRKTAPRAALVLGILLAANPWLIAFSDEARGYSLMLLLGVLATNVLPDGKKRWPLAYALLLTATLYTVYVAALLIPAHATVTFILRRSAFRSWMRGLFLALLFCAVLYLPMSRAIIDYFHNPLAAPSSYFDFVNELPRFALTADAPSGFICWLLPVVLLIAGSSLVRSHPELKPLLITMASATVAGLLAPILVRSSVQVRFVPWIAVWICVAITSILLTLKSRIGNFAMIAALIVAAGSMIFRDITLPPNQPIREAIGTADAIAQPGDALVVGFLSARESFALYRRDAPNHAIAAGPSIPVFLRCEQNAIQSTGRRPWVIISYETMLKNYSPEFWLYFNQNYRLVMRLDGRISPVAIYAPREAALSG